MIQKHVKLLESPSSQQIEKNINELLKEGYIILSSGVSMDYTDKFQYTKYFAFLQKEWEDGCDPYTSLV